MNTVKLFYEDAYMRSFRAQVLSCEPEGDRWAVVLDKTAFFPEEGGQSADTGTMGGVTVTDVKEKKGVVIHYTDAPLQPGAEIDGAIDWDERFRKMQTHTGEHIVSGIVHARYGFENVGFHLGEDGCTFDFDGELTREQLVEIEQAANAAVWANKPITTAFPAPEELKALTYRSKLDLTENVRLVTIEDVDVCACCAPHVSGTAQVGMIKLLDYMRHRGGVRIWAKCGSDAWRDYHARYTATAAISAMLNTPQEKVVPGVEQLLAQRDALKQELTGLKLKALEAQAAAAEPTEGHRLLFVEADDAGMRALVNGVMEKTGGICAVFSGTEGAWQFVMGSETVDLRSFVKEQGASLRLRGGGQPRMISGRCMADRKTLEEFFTLNR